MTTLGFTPICISICLTAGKTPVCKQRPLQWCREHLGLHPCDRRSSLTYLKQQYPAVDFSLVSLSVRT